MRTITVHRLSLQFDWAGNGTPQQAKTIMVRAVNAAMREMENNPYLIDHHDDIEIEVGEDEESRAELSGDQSEPLTLDEEQAEKEALRGDHDREREGDR